MPTFTSYKSGLQVTDEPAYRTHLAIYMDYPNSVLLNQWGVGIAKDPNAGLNVNGSFGASTNGIVASTIGGYALTGNATGGGYGVRGFNAAGFGVGVEGVSTNNVGVLGSSTNGVGVQGNGPIGVYARSSTATSGSFAIQAYNIASVQLFSVRGDGYSSFMNGNLTVSNSGGYTILDATNYGNLKISLTGGGFGDYALFRVNGDILLQRPTVIGNSSSPSATCTLEVGSAFGESSVGVKNVSFGNASAGHGTFSMGGQGSGGTYGPQSVRFLYDPVSFGGLATDINNNYFRIGFGINAVSTHRVNVADGLKVVTGGVNLTGIPVGNAGLLSGDIYADTAANILLNGDLVIGRKV